ncbi:MAG: PTS sugar transporter subunit IIC [Myxococcales bacterium]
MSPLDYAAAGLVSGLLGLERKAFLQAALSRPLVAGGLIGLVMGRPIAGLLVGAALELFFASAVALGAALPDNELFATGAAAACACALLDGVAAERASWGPLLLATVLMLPVGKLGKTSDRLGLKVNARIAGGALGDGPVRARLRHNVFGLWTPFVTTAAVTTAGAALGGLLLPHLWRALPEALQRSLGFAWPALLIASAAIAVRGIRLKNAGTLGLRAFGVAAVVQAAALLWGAR